MTKMPRRSSSPRSGKRSSDQGDDADPAALLREVIDWKAGFCVHGR